MQIKYWTDFSKRKNSTKQPTGGTTATVTLKEPCGIASPSFISASIPESVKYIEAWGRYYFVSEVTHDGPEIIISCVSDPLATFKSAIGSTYADVEYTSSSSLITIPDGRNRPTNEILTKTTNLGTLPTFNESAACFIVGVNDDAGCSYYMMNDSKFSDFLSVIFNKSVNGQLTRSFFDMNNILISTCVIPRYAISGTDSITLDGVFGTAITLLSGVYRIAPADRMITLYEDIKDINYPSDDYSYGQNYLDCSPYSTGTIYLPFVGCVDLDVGVMASQKSLYIKVSFDQINGDIVYKLGLDSSRIIATYSGNCAANVPVSGNSFNPSGAAAGSIATMGGVAALVAGIATEGASTAIAGLGGLAAGASTTFSSLSHKSQINGSLSSYIACKLGLDIRATVITRKPAETNLRSYQSISGMPYYKSATISNLSGFVKCNGASVNISGFDSDREAVNAYLNSGFYYE